MSSIYVDCFTGVATDMLAAALIGLCDDKTGVLSQLQLYMPKNIILNLEFVNNLGIHGHKLTIRDTHWQAHHIHGHSLATVQDWIISSSAPTLAKQVALSVYDHIATAECKVHDVDLNSIHFHEVGQPRAAFGILAVASLYTLLAPEKMVFSPINVGYGKVECAHGIVSVPAPATAIIIDGMPTYHTEGLEGELCTPSGAALVKTLANSYSECKPSKYNKTSVGIGGKDIGVAGGLVCYYTD